MRFRLANLEKCFPEVTNILVAQTLYSHFYVVTLGILTGIGTEVNGCARNGGCATTLVAFSVCSGMATPRFPT
jgi:hypothetical protein